MAAAAAALASALALAAVPVPGEARAALGRCGDPAQRPWCDTALTPDRRTALLMPELTGDEKIALLASDDPFGGPLGGFFETAHADTADGIERLGIPPVYMADGPAGVRQGKATALPAPIALAAGFDREAAACTAGRSRGRPGTGATTSSSGRPSTSCARPATAGRSRASARTPTCRRRWACPGSRPRRTGA